MKVIDEYLNRIYKNNKSKEVLELKEEMREHLLESTNDLIREGYNQDEAINKAISMFDGGLEMTDDIYSEFIEKNDIKKIRNLFFIFSILTLICMLMGYNNISLSFESKEAEKTELRLKNELYDIINSKNIIEIKKNKSKIDRLLSRNEFNQISSLYIYDKLDYTSESQDNLYDVSLMREDKNEIINSQDIVSADKNSNVNLIYHYSSGDPDAYSEWNGKFSKYEQSEELYYLIKYKHKWYYDIENKATIAFGVVTTVIFAIYYKKESEHLKSIDGK